MIGFIKYMRTEKGKRLHEKPIENHVLSIIAIRVSREGNPVKGVRVGESIISDYKGFGLSRQQLRTAISNLQKWGYITTRATNKGSYATLIDTSVYDCNIAEPTNKDSSNQPPNTQTANHNQEVKKKEDNNIIDFEYYKNCDSRSPDYINVSFGIKDAQTTLQNIYEPKGWLIAKVKELTEADRSQEWCYNVLHDFATTGITNYHSRITCPNKLNDKFCNWIKNAIKFEQENEAKAKKENKSLSMNDHLKANMIPKNYNYIKRKGKLDEYIADFKNYEFKYNNIAKAYKNKSITAPLIYEIAHTSLGRGLHGTTELKKIDSLKAFVNNLSDYNQSQGDIRKLIQEHSKKTDL